MPEPINLGMLLEQLSDIDEEYAMATATVTDQDGAVLTGVDIVGEDVILEFSEVVS